MPKTKRFLTLPLSAKGKLDSMNSTSPQGYFIHAAQGRIFILPEYEDIYASVIQLFGDHSDRRKAEGNLRAPQY